MVFKLAPAEDSLIELKYCTLLKGMLCVQVLLLLLPVVLYIAIVVIVVVVKHC